MKKYSILVLTLVLTAALLVGCGCTNRNVGNSSTPTVLPTNGETLPSSRPTTGMTSEATSEATGTPTSGASTPSETNNNSTNATVDRGNGPLEDDTATTENTVAGRARQGMLGVD